jgi:hypothetical protein
MPAAGGVTGFVGGGLDSRHLDPSGLTDCVSEGFQVVRVRQRRRELPRVAQHFPAPGDREPDGVLLAQVIGMGLGERRQWSDDRR